MNIERAVIKKFRNIENMEFEPSNGINVIYGENGHGKQILSKAFGFLPDVTASEQRKIRSL